MHSYSSGPSVYTLQLSAIPYISRDYAPLRARIKALNRHLHESARFLEQAERNLDRSLAKRIVEVSISQADGVVLQPQYRLTPTCRHGIGVVSCLERGTAAPLNFVEDLLSEGKRLCLPLPQRPILLQPAAPRLILSMNRVLVDSKCRWQF